jgi:uncharacterized protein YoxC
MNTILLAIITAVFLVLAGFLIPLLLELKKTIVSLRNNTEKNREELEFTLKSVRGITDNVNDITEDVKEFVGSVTEVGKKIRAVNMLIDTAGSSASVKAMSLKAGITAAVTFLITNLLKKGDRQ